MKPDKVIKFKDSYRDYYILELLRIPATDDTGGWWVEMYSSHDGNNKKDNILSTIIEGDELPMMNELLDHINSRMFSIQLALAQEMTKQNWP